MLHVSFSRFTEYHCSCFLCVERYFSLFCNSFQSFRCDTVFVRCQSFRYCNIVNVRWYLYFFFSEFRYHWGVCILQNVERTIELYGTMKLTYRKLSNVVYPDLSTMYVWEYTIFIHRASRKYSDHGIFVHIFCVLCKMFSTFYAHCKETRLSWLYW